MGAALLLRASVVLGFAAVAMFFNLNRQEGFSTQEAMESAHLARQLAEAGDIRPTRSALSASTCSSKAIPPMRRRCCNIRCRI